MNGPTWKRFSASLLELQECTSPPGLGPALIKSMQALLEADLYAVNWHGTDKILEIPNVAGEVPWAVKDAVDILNSHLHEHPLLPMVNASRADGLTRASRWSDVSTLRQFRQTGLYHDYYRLLPSNRQLALGVRINAKVFLSLTFNRQGLDFQKKDGRTLEAISPHVGYVVRTMMARAEVEDALALRELAGRSDAVMIVDESGKIVFATDRALQLMRDYFFVVREDSLPPDLAGWLRSSPPPGVRLSRQRPAGQLICVCGPLIPWAGGTVNAIFNGGHRPKMVRCLRMVEERESDIILVFQSCGLTPREAEVLQWITKGKRDEEIGLILGMSTRTVNHHVQAIVRKLGVETRGGAAWEALERVKHLPAPHTI